MIKIELPGVPLVWKAPYVGTRGAYSIRTPIKEQLRAIARNQFQGPLFDRQLNVDIFFYLPVPLSASRKKRLLMLSGEIRPTGRQSGDLSNLRKFAEDVLIGVVYSDDKYIVSGETSKWYCENPRSVIKISTI